VEIALRGGKAITVMRWLRYGSLWFKEEYGECVFQRSSARVEKQI